MALGPGVRLGPYEIVAPVGARGRLMDDPVTLVDRVATSSNFYAAFSASTNGVLAYATTVVPGALAWIGRDGRRLGVAAGPSQYCRLPTLS
jgi:hypothetical protein